MVTLKSYKTIEKLGPGGRPDTSDVPVSPPGEVYSREKTRIRGQENKSVGN